MIDDGKTLAANRRSLIITALLDVVAILALGFGIYAKASGNDDGSLVNVMLGAGIALAMWCAWRFFILIRQRAALVAGNP